MTSAPQKPDTHVRSCQLACSTCPDGPIRALASWPPSRRRRPGPAERATTRSRSVERRLAPGQRCSTRPAGCSRRTATRRRRWATSPPPQGSASVPSTNTSVTGPTSWRRSSARARSACSTTPRRCGGPTRAARACAACCTRSSPTTAPRRSSSGCGRRSPTSTVTSRRYAASSRARTPRRSRHRSSKLQAGRGVHSGRPDRRRRHRGGVGVDGRPHLLRAVRVRPPTGPGRRAHGRRPHRHLVERRQGNSGYPERSRTGPGHLSGAPRTVARRGAELVSSLVRDRPRSGPAPRRTGALFFSVIIPVGPDALRVLAGHRHSPCRHR